MGKSRNNHLTLELYLLALRGELSLGALLKQGHTHLLERCQTCRKVWYDEGEHAAPPFGDEDEEVEDENATSKADVEDAIERYSMMRKLYREAHEDVSNLLQLPRGTWSEKIKRGRVRFRSRAFAQRLVAESKRRVRDDPLFAADLVGLVPISLRWATERRNRSWAWALVASAEAHRGNALRISGDLAAAGAVFAKLKVALEDAPWKCPDTLAEIASLHSTLYVEQGRYNEADECLHEARRCYEEARTPDGSARVLIKRANLAGIRGNREQSYILHVEAAALLEKEAFPYLHLTTVTGRVLALADLDRLADAWSLLESHRDAYERHAGKYGAGLWKCLVGRLALQEDSLDEAKELLEDGRDTLLALGRHQDAAMASLDLATVHAKAGEVDEVRELAGGLAEVFKTLGIGRELLATLALLADSGHAELSMLALIDELRRSLELHAASM